MTDIEKGAHAAAPSHPATKLYALSLLMLLLAVVLGFITVFVPWVQKDIAVGKRAFAYPFKTCIEDTFSDVNAYSCQDNDVIAGYGKGVPLTGNNSTCKAYFLTVIAFVFISVIGGVVLLLLGAWIFMSLWARPLKRAMLFQLGLIVTCISAFLAWIFFICYAEKECAPNSIFPVKGYSYGFICYVFASVLWLGAVVTGFAGLMKVKSFLPDKQDRALVDQPMEDAVYPEYPMYDPSGSQPSPTPVQPPVGVDGMSYYGA